MNFIAAVWEENARLHAETRQLQALILALADRVAAQSEALSQRAETRPADGAAVRLGHLADAMFAPCLIPPFTEPTKGGKS